jgi:hypothetical protein
MRSPEAADCADTDVVAKHEAKVKLEIKRAARRIGNLLLESGAKKNPSST